MRQIMAFALLLFFILTHGLPAQERTPASKKRPAAPVSSSPRTRPSDLRPQARKVAEQLKLLSRFLYVYGKIATRFETGDQLNRSDISESAKAQWIRNRAAVAHNIGGFRDGLEKLEPEFQANTRLRSFYPALAGISDTIARAEQLASNDQFDEAGKALVAAAESLTDLLVGLK